MFQSVILSDSDGITRARLLLRHLNHLWTGTQAAQTSLALAAGAARDAQTIEPIFSIDAEGGRA
jgi:hypothetical protein